jgi:hypothetical protein
MWLMGIEVEEESSQEVADTSTPEPATSTVETPAVEVAETPAEPVVETPAPAFSIRDYLKETVGRDLSSKYQTDEEAAKGIDHAIKLASQKSEKERQFDQLAPYLPQFQQFLASQQQQVQQPVKQEPDKPFTPPAVKETDKRWVETDPTTGERQIKANAPLDVRQRLEAFVNYVDEYNYRLQHAPHELYQEFEQRAAQQAEEKAFQRLEVLLVQRERQAYEQQSVSKIKSELADRIYVKNTAGQPLTDETGTPILTPFGQTYIVRHEELWRQYGENLPTQERHRIALEHAELRTGQTAKAPTLAPGATKAKNISGGAVSQKERTVPRNTSLSEMIFAENPGVDRRELVDGLTIQ